MEAPEVNPLELLPPRPSRPQDWARSFQQKFLSNYYNVIINMHRNTFYQYSIDVEIPADSSEELDKLMRNLKRELVNDMDVLCWKGKMCWGTKSKDKLEIEYKHT